MRKKFFLPSIMQENLYNFITEIFQNFGAIIKVIRLLECSLNDEENQKYRKRKLNFVCTKRILNPSPTSTLIRVHHLSCSNIS